LKVLKFIYDNINFRMGAVGGFLSGCIAFYVNIDAGFEAALVPATKQFLYGLLVGGSLVHLSQHVSVAIANKTWAVLLGAIIPAVITTVLITAIHLFKGTPNPTETILFTASPTPFGFFIVALFNRNREDKKQLI
jgi:hypothetical protein